MVKKIKMAWFYLTIAGIFEIVWAVGMKYTQGFTRLWPSVGVLIAMALSVYFLALAIKTVPVGTAYAIWTGIGIAGTALWGIIFFNESVNIVRILLIMLILLSVVGLRLITK